MLDLLHLKRVYEGWASYAVATFRTASGAEVRREIEDHGDAVAVLPYDPERRCVLVVEQFRAPMFLAHRQLSVFEAVAGGLEPGEEPDACVRREAMEEAGVRLDRLEPLGLAAAMPGISTERLHLFLARYAAKDRIGEGGGLAAEHEEITVHELAFRDVCAMADRGELLDLKTLALVQALRIRRPELAA